jgi:hypothetical protein
MAHGSAFFQVKDKCLSLEEINLIIQKKTSQNSPNPKSAGCFTLNPLGAF